jgi:hypothetical protein
MPVFIGPLVFSLPIREDAKHVLERVQACALRVYQSRGRQDRTASGDLATSALKRRGGRACGLGWRCSRECTQPPANSRLQHGCDVSPRPTRSLAPANIPTATACRINSLGGGLLGGRMTLAGWRVGGGVAARQGAPHALPSSKRRASRRAIVLCLLAGAEESGWRGSVGCAGLLPAHET